VIVYGRNAVRETLRGSRAVTHIWATRASLREPWLASVGATGAVSVEAVTAEEVERRCHSDGHQGVCAEVSEFVYADGVTLLDTAGNPLLAALDQVQDPQNLGAICRSAECAGARGVVLPERRAVDVTPAVCKASAGAVEHLPIAHVRNLADFLDDAKARGFWCYGADAHGSIG
jgi:23S rRNA (guanosine2251-2'-O)-methyltransferase